MVCTTPVVIFIYKRSQNLEKMINGIREARPKELYIVADGSKNTGEEEQVKKTRADLESLISWPCQVRKSYSTKNLGLKRRFSTGIDWVFKHTDRAIFVEDDCVPESSFFIFCDQLLKKYKDEERIVSISGNNFQQSNKNYKESYYFSRYPHVWGWATWKRVWDQYDSTISDWPKLKHSGWLSELYPKRFFTQKFWTYIFDRLYSGKINTWDYQLTYLSMKLHGLNIIPGVNLVKNVGYGADATNLKKKNKTIDVTTKAMKFPLIHPSKLTYSDQEDKYIEELVYLHPLGKISLFIKSLLGIV